VKRTIKTSRRVSQKQRFTVLLEEIDGKLDNLGVGHGVLIKRMDGIGERFDAVDKRFDEMATKAEIKIMFERQSKDMMNALGETDQKINKRIDNLVDALKPHGIAVVAA